MALSYNAYTGNGSTTTYAITINYLLESHLHVYVDETEVFSPATWSQIGTDIEFVTAPINAAEIKIARETPRTLTGRLVDFTDSSTLSETDLDTSAVQLLYIAQEAFETDITGSLATDYIKYSAALVGWDAAVKKIVRVVDPTADQDAATKKYVDDTALQLSAGEYDAGSLPINNVEDPTDLQDAATKNYVDQIAVWGHAGTPNTVLLTTDSAINSYTLTGVPGASTEMVIVTIGGVVQVPGSGNDYTVTAGDPDSTLVLTSFPPDGVELFVYAIGREILIPAASIGTGEITTAMLADLSVTTAKLAADAVTNAKLADDAVETANILDDAVTTAKIASDAITSNKLATDSVEEAKILAGAVSYAKLKTTGFTANPSTSTDQFIAIAGSTGNQSKRQLVAADLSDFNSALAATPISTLAQATTTINMGANKILGVADPTLAQDAATKAYVDTEVSGASASGARGPYLLVDQTLGLNTTAWDITGFLASQYVRYEIVFNNCTFYNTGDVVYLRVYNTATGSWLTSHHYDNDPAITSNNTYIKLGQGSNYNKLNGRVNLYNNLTASPDYVVFQGKSICIGNVSSSGEFSSASDVHGTSVVSGNIDGIRLSQVSGGWEAGSNIKIYGYTSL